MKRKSQRSVQVVVSVPARNRSQTHTTRFSSWKVLSGSRFVCKYTKCRYRFSASAENQSTDCTINRRLRARDAFLSKSPPVGSCSGNNRCNLLRLRDPNSSCAPLSLLLWSLLYIGRCASLSGVALANTLSGEETSCRAAKWSRRTNDAVIR